MTETTSERTKSFLARTAYLIAAVLFVLPIMDIAIGLLPLQTDNIRWRVGVIALGTGALALPIIALFIAYITAYARGHRRMQYFLVASSALASLVLLALVVLFTLDTLQLRNEVAETGRKLYDRVSLKGIMAQVILVVTLAMMAVGGWRTSRATARDLRREKRGEAAPIVVGKTADGRTISTPAS